MNIHFFTQADNQPPAPVVLQQHKNEQMLERVFTASEFYRGFNTKTLEAVRRGFELEPDFCHHDGEARMPVEYLSERIGIITTILEQRQEERASMPHDMANAYKQVEAGIGMPITKYDRKGGGYGR